MIDVKWQKFNRVHFKDTVGFIKWFMSCAASCLASGEELPGAIKMEGFNRQRVDHLPFLCGMWQMTSLVLTRKFQTDWLRLHFWTFLAVQWCWDSACQCRGHGFDPRSGKAPHVMGQLSLCHNYRACMLQLWKPKHPSPCIHQEKTLQWEACAP